MRRLARAVLALTIAIYGSLAPCCADPAPAKVAMLNTLSGSTWLEAVRACPGATASLLFLHLRRDGADYLIIQVYAQIREMYTSIMGLAQQVIRLRRGIPWRSSA
jgi:hypothetical protein